MARRPTLADRAAAWLAEQLAGGPLPTAEVQRRAAATDWIAPDTLRRAREKLGVVSRKARDVNGTWTIELPRA